MGFHFYLIFNAGMKNVYFLSTHKKNGNFISIARGEGAFIANEVELFQLLQYLKDEENSFNF